MSLMVESSLNQKSRESEAQKESCHRHDEIQTTIKSSEAALTAKIHESADSLESKIQNVTLLLHDLGADISQQVTQSLGMEKKQGDEIKDIITAALCEMKTVITPSHSRATSASSATSEELMHAKLDNVKIFKNIIRWFI
jgi:hypothetical protein